MDFFLAHSGIDGEQLFLEYLEISAKYRTAHKRLMHPSTFTISRPGADDVLALKLGELLI